jgi:cytochrome c oxidase assembly protein subunit 15
LGQPRDEPFEPRGGHVILAGLYVGLLSAVLNLMILGSLLGGGQGQRVLHSAVWWVPAWLAFSAALASLGAAAGAIPPYRGDPIHWTGVLSKVAAATVLLLLAVGGMVTSKAAGLAVVDWPNSFGYFMFLLPLSRMTGGSYLEHSHRLIGSLVGLTTLVLAIHLWLTDLRRNVRWLILLALLAVIVQGILGGLRVTGRLTLSQNPADVSPSILLAVAHGVFGQVVFSLLTGVAVMTSTAWYGSVAAGHSPGRRTDRILTLALVILLLAQLTVGALVRHTVLPKLLMFHVSLATVVMVMAVLTGARAWGLYGRPFAMLGRFGLSFVAVACLQVLIGILSMVVTGARFGLQTLPRPTSPGAVVITTLHQTIGAITLAVAVGLAFWMRREPMMERPVRRSCNDQQGWDELRPAGQAAAGRQTW